MNALLASARLMELLNWYEGRQLQIQSASLTLQWIVPIVGGAPDARIEVPVAGMLQELRTLLQVVEAAHIDDYSLLDRARRFTLYLQQQELQNMLFVRELEKFDNVQ